MKSGARSVLLVVLAGCASAHRLVAPLAYDKSNLSAGRSDDAFGAPPAVMLAPAPRCIEWQKYTLSNGIPLFVAERHALPSATVRIVLTTDAMAPEDFVAGDAKRLDLLAAAYLRGPDVNEDVSAQCTRASCWIAERVRAAEAADALGQLASWITNPQADERSDIQRFVAAADSLRRGEDIPTLVLWRNAETMAFGRSTRPAVEPTMTEVIQTRAQLLQPAAANLVVVGDVSAVEVEAQAERAFGGWRSDRDPSQPAMSVTKSSEPSFVPRVAYVPSNPYASPLAAIVVRGPASVSPDVWAFRVVVQILGGGMESELFVHVREEMAASYVPGASVRWFPGASVAAFGGLLDQGKVIAATRVMLSSVREMREHGPDLGAIERGKARLKTEVQGSVSTNWLLASSLEVSRRDVHPIDPCDAARRIDGVTPDDVRAVMRMYFAERRLGVVVIAREDQLDAWPADLNMGPVQRRDWLGQDLP
jgi:predicted Zn-dependent peptidase